MNVLPIAPSPVVVAGLKRKLGGSSTSNADILSSTSSGGSTTSSIIPRRESAPATLAQVAEVPQANLKPSEYWKSLLEDWEVPILDTVGIDHKSDSVVFLETTPDRVEAYQNIELLAAVRRRDLVILKKIAAEKHASGGTMNACNRFGESILHLACRKGSLDVVKLLVGSEVDGCDCSLLVRDDYGRTVLHDACWTVNPPWELIKLILKKAPVLWRVSDVRGHLALQYVPKTAWPQWAAFLSKNKDLLQRIMVHSYHQIDILNQPSQEQQQPVQTKQERVDIHDSGTNDASTVLPHSLPQHQQIKQETGIEMVTQQIPEVGAVSPVPHLSAAKATQAAHSNRAAAAQNMALSVLSLGTGGGAAGTSAQQAQDILARALGQANSAMVQAISKGQHSPRQQGLSRFAPSLAANAVSAIKAEGEECPPQQAAVPMVQAPGPATKALDEALRAQSATRSKARSNSNYEEYHDRPHKSTVNRPSQDQHENPKPKNDGAATPLPYAPSISMIAARLAGYQKNNASREDAHPPQESQGQSSVDEPQRNPLPAVPNPLMAVGSQHGVSSPEQQQNQIQDQQGVPSSITTTKNSASDSMVPNPMLANAEDAQGHGHGNSKNNNSISSVTMSGSRFVLEENGSETTGNGTTDTDSDRVSSSSSSSNPSPEDEAAAEAAMPMDTSLGESHGQAPMDTSIGDVTESPPNANPDENNNNKPSQDGSKKRVVG